MPRRPHSDKDMIGVVNRVAAGGTVEKEREIYGCTAEDVARWKNEFANKFALNNRSRRPVFQEPFYRIFFFPAFC